MNQQLPAPHDSDLSTPHDDDTVSLGTPARIACGAIATIAGAAGGVGSFIPDTNSGGVPVLLGIAALFGYLAISGQRITLLKLGDNEARLSRAVRAAGRALDDPTVPDETKAEIALDLETIGGTLPADTRRAVEAVLISRQVASAYEKALQTTLLSMFPEEYVGNGRFDALLQSSSTNLVVEAKYLDVNRRVLLQQAANQLQNFLTMPTLTAGLLVTNLPVSDDLHEYLHRDSSHRMAAVTWRGPEDDEALREAVRRLLTT